MIRRIFPALVFIAFAALLGACGSTDSQTGSDQEIPGSFVMDEAAHERWEISLVEMRIEKNEAFSNPNSTPLPVNKVKSFEGLNYYLPFPEMRFQTPFLAEAGTDTVSLAKRDGKIVPYLKRGVVKFRWQDAVHSLDVFGPVAPEGEDYLWLPFYDQNSGQETYAGGRYLDIEVDDAGMVDLDFNFAYNPLCDYNAERYNCTLPPQSNTLPFSVNAGEKKFSREH